ncbi:MAG TPA: hypothetical protein VJT73_10765 [Polyangiaceae bacterium]|nr:hypothetical protein [Polyangiaceae bacterium]
MTSLLVITACETKMLEVGTDGGSAMATPGTPTGARWTGNAADCPSARPEPLTPCAVAGGQSCVYWPADQASRNDFEIVSCYENAPGSRLWYKHLVSSFIRADKCPHEEPTTGEGCFGLSGIVCPYPVRRECVCRENVWACVAEPLLQGPSDLPLSTAVKDASAAHREAWCTWYAQLGYGPGWLLPDELPVDDNGYAQAPQGGEKINFFGACYATGVAVSQCAANMALATACEATLDELSDCAMTVQRGLPSPHGCARLLSRPNCQGLLIHAGDSGSDAGDSGSDAGFGLSLSCITFRVR